MALYFSAVCRDHADGRSVMLRQTAMAAHLAYIESIFSQVAIAGPLKDAQGQPCGSILIYRAASLDAARALLENDPYFQAGVWAETNLHPFVAAAGEWIGGKTW